MALNVSLFVAWRYWRSKSADRFGRIVTWLGSIGITLGVMALVIVLSVMNGLQHQQKVNVLSSLPHAIIMPQQGHLPVDFTLPHTQGIMHAVPINQSDVILQTASGMSAARLLGVQSWDDDPTLADETADFDRTLPAGGYRIALPYSLAQQLNLQVGDKVRVMLAANSQYTPFGRVPVQRLFEVSAVLDSSQKNDGHSAFANLADVGRLLRIAPDEVQGMRVFMQDPFKVTALSHDFPEEKWKIADWREQKGEFFQAVAMEKNMMGLLIGLIIIVAIANIVTSLSLMVLDKQGEIAILQTQGMQKRDVMGIFILQGLLVGVSGTAIGLLAGFLVASNINEIMHYLPLNSIHLPVLFDHNQLLLIGVLTLTLTLLSTLYPAYRAAKIEPADALRYE
ncbi:lipoprotein-releasing ABC transporter permease subunit [Pasteurellaceae bacterium HPA106]|uniref:lipoprotein-releasing ABC transporter permease subunit n=1 Tax=Spirabiliibacterium pneumoniae TaxID=221400 RepID=UPI001AAC544C|nr:lipoprotein-releasing ABC transporter permease subunit [Spirabiliibacterium pneumoniae]MBE2895428.1 lipoprotein-releasing ABC transporter permease subunit [Spirabiliibacterium pneumoniae]